MLDCHKKVLVVGMGLLLCLFGTTGCIDTSREAKTHMISGKVTMVGSPQGSDVDLSQVSTTLKQQGGGGVEVSDTADADGAFEFVSPPGLYEVVAEVSGSQCGSVSVNTAESHAQNVVLECRVK